MLEGPGGELAYCRRSIKAVAYSVVLAVEGPASGQTGKPLVLPGRPWVQCLQRPQAWMPLGGISGLAQGGER